MTAEEAKKLGGTSKQQTVAPSGNTEGATADNTPTPTAEVPGTIQMLEARAQQSASKLAEQEKAKEVQSMWEPTRDNIKRTGLNFGGYLSEARKAGAKVDPMETLLQFYGQDPNMSIEEAEKAKKREERKRNMDLIGNALMHAGNFIGSMVGGHGAVKLEDPVKFTERQQQLKDKSDALVKSQWKDVYDTYKAKQAEERAQKVADYNDRKLQEQQVYHDKLAAIAAGKAEETAKNNEANRDLKAKEFEHKERKDNKQLAISQQNADSRRITADAAASRANTAAVNSNKDYTDEHTVTYNELGQKTGESKSRHYGTSHGGGNKIKRFLTK